MKRASQRSAHTGLASGYKYPAYNIAGGRSPASGAPVLTCIATTFVLLPFAEAVSTTRALLGASHEDLRLRAHQLSRGLSIVFFPCAAAAGAFAERGRAWFPEGGLYVCADLPPLSPAVRAVLRVLMQVVVKEASYDVCVYFYDTVRDMLWQLVGDARDGRGPVVFDREKFEAAFALEGVE
ncbi:hypothetical protein SETIT_2G214400v2 [Setaria italica]|uniref:Uncharacterized protein n=2 Tax=Setaria italica TaxID=4555 RepID=A0A368Q290_SETIT|nr:hypothetical protein SETIT_2G214400v2 [Setaria italica]